MPTTAENAVATQTYTVYIKASAAAVWDAVTNPDQTDRYGYQGRVEYELQPGGSFLAHPGASMAGAPDPLIVGEVLEADAPHRLVQTWNPLFGTPITEEAATQLTWDIAEENGIARVSLTHELGGAPLTAGLVSG
jgi:uncharacterized protein YndB with AHSA1/START domain